MATRLEERTREAESVVRSIVERIDPALKCEIRSAPLLVGVIRVRLERLDRGVTKRAFAVVTSEAWTKAKTQPTEMERQLRAVIEGMEGRPKQVFLVTTGGLDDEPLNEGVETLDNASAWEPHQLSATGKEADEIARRFFAMQTNR